METKAFVHLMNRAGFGVSPWLWEKRDQRSAAEWTAWLLADSAEVLPLDGSGAEIPERRTRQMTPGKRKEQRKEHVRLLMQQNVRWIDRMTSGKGMLREKMTLFWHDHFACRFPTILFTETQNHTLREYALGSFRDLLFAISKDPGMLNFLNNQQNKKEEPNENFARELLELFTLGRGHYTEHDIKEAARAFTGWGFKLTGEFVFRRFQHDEGEKAFLGRSGNFGGEDILNIVLEERQTARYLTEKLYRYFIHPELNEEVVEEWATLFYESDYDIPTLLMTMFHSNHFYEAQNIGVRIKSPVEYLVGLKRKFDLQFNEEKGIIFIQKALGQTLFQPPNVAGWPDGRGWIDGSSLLFRMQLPRFLLAKDEFDFNVKQEFAGNEEPFKPDKGIRSLETQVGWEGIESTVSAQDLTAFLLSVPPREDLDDLVSALRGPMIPEDQYRKKAIALVCSPEFQLC